MYAKKFMCKIVTILVLFMVSLPVSLFSVISTNASETWGGRIKSLSWKTFNNIEYIKVEILNTGKGDEKYRVKASLVSIAKQDTNAQTKEAILRTEKKDTGNVKPRKTTISYITKDWRNQVKGYDESFSYYVVVELCEAGIPHRVIHSQRIAL